MKRHVIVADNARKVYHVATFWALWGTDGTAINGNPDAPCFTIIKTFAVSDDAVAWCIQLNSANKRPVAA